MNTRSIVSELNHFFNLEGFLPNPVTLKRNDIMIYEDATGTVTIHLNETGEEVETQWIWDEIGEVYCLGKWTTDSLKAAFGWE